MQVRDKSVSIDKFNIVKKNLLESTNSLIVIYTLLTESHNSLLENKIAKNDSEYLFTIRNNLETLSSRLNQLEDYKTALKGVHYD